VRSSETLMVCLLGLAWRKLHLKRYDARRGPRSKKGSAPKTWPPHAGDVCPDKVRDVGGEAARSGMRVI